MEIDRSAKNLIETGDVENFLVEMNQKYSIPIIASNNTSFIKKEDREKFLKVLKSKFNSLPVDYSPADSWLKNQDEMQELYEDIPQAYNNTMKLFNEIDLFYPSKWIHPAQYGNENEHNKILNEIRTIK